MSCRLIIHGDIAASGIFTATFKKADGYFMTDWLVSQGSDRKAPQTIFALAPTNC